MAGGAPATFFYRFGAGHLLLLGLLLLGSVYAPWGMECDIKETTGDAKDMNRNMRCICQGGEYHTENTTIPGVRIGEDRVTGRAIYSEDKHETKSTWKPGHLSDCPAR